MKISKINKDKHSIGDRFTLEDGTQLDCVKEAYSCIDCYFSDIGMNCDKIKHIIVCCSFTGRYDLTGVIFKKVK